METSTPPAHSWQYHLAETGCGLVLQTSHREVNSWYPSDFRSIPSPDVGQVPAPLTLAFIVIQIGFMKDSNPGSLSSLEQTSLSDPFLIPFWNYQRIDEIRVPPLKL